MKSSKNVNFPIFFNITLRRLLFHVLMIAPIMMMTSCYSVSITKRKHNSGYHVSIARSTHKAFTKADEQSVNQNLDENSAFEDFSNVSVDENQVEKSAEMNFAQKDDHNVTDLELKSTNGVNTIRRVNQFTRPAASLSGIAVKRIFENKLVNQAIDKTKHEDAKPSSDFGYGLSMFFFYLFLFGGLALLLIGLLAGPDLLLSLAGAGLMILAAIIMAFAI
jgi:hypothetical protein